jgi:hypothetical protein
LIADLLGNGDRKPTWSAPRIQHCYARLKIEVFYYEGRTIGFGKGVVQFDKPA